MLYGAIGPDTKYMGDLKSDTDAGKSAIAAAITAMGQTASGSETYAQLATHIQDISDDANAGVGDVLATKTFYQGGSKKTGTMPNNGSVGTVNLTTEGQEYTIAAGYHNGLGKVKAVITNLIASVIKAGTTVGGILGTFTADATATAAKILTGFSGYVNAVKIDGTMPDRSGDTAALASSVVGTTLKLTASDGYRDGVDDNVTITDAAFVAGNIKTGATVHGLAGTYTNDANAAAGDILLDKTAYVNGSKLTGTLRKVNAGTYIFAAADTEQGPTINGSYAVVKSIRIHADGIYRVSFDIKMYNTGTSYGKIYKNGVAYGTERSNATSTYVTFTEDLSFSAGDTVELWRYNSGGGGTYVRNFRLYAVEGTEIVLN